MKRSIRVLFMLMISLQTVLVFAAIGTMLVFFNIHEQHEHPQTAREEAREAMVVLATMGLMLPFALVSGWWVSRRLLRPWARLVTDAERISEGHLGDRLQVLNPDDEIGRLSHTLNDAFDRYDAALERLHRFSFDASHQLRNPLAAIRTSGEVALSKSRSSEEYQAAIGTMLEDLDRLNRTVEQLLMLARASEGAIRDEMAPFDLIPLVNETLEEAAAIGEASNVTLESQVPSTPLTMIGARDLLYQALMNLLDNALRFAPPSSTITVAASACDNEGVEITVTDAGPGLPASRREDIFKPFERGAAGDRGQTGLGLAIVADICRAHGGMVGVDPAPGGGCRFRMRLPA